MNILLTSSYTKPIRLCYRLPGKDVRGNAYPVLQIDLPSCALNYEVSFPSEAHFEAFKLQHVEQIANKEIFVGKASGSVAEKVNNEMVAKEAKAKKAKQDKELDKVNETAESAGAKLKIKVTKESKD